MRKESLTDKLADDLRGHISSNKAVFEFYDEKNSTSNNLTVKPVRPINGLFSLALNFSPKNTSVLFPFCYTGIVLIVI